MVVAMGATAWARGASDSATVGKGYRFSAGGWTFVHLEGKPGEIGFQHGALLSREIADMLGVIQLETRHDTKREWGFYRETAQKELWPKIDEEYRQELEGIAKGAASKGVKLDVWDITALNAWLELSEYYVPWLEKKMGEKAELKAHLLPDGRCSAFIATGSWTRGGKIVIAHNNWATYAEGERWTVMFDILPSKGHRILMDGVPGVITSDDDFGENDAGMMIAETTIIGFEGWNPEGKPEFMRSRKALQYAGSIDEYAALIKEGNNGGYANDWLIGDSKTGEIGYLELGLKNTPLWRTKDGYFISSNFARDPEVLKFDTPTFDYNDLSKSPNARRVTWEKKMAQYKGQIDVALAEKLESDHADSFDGKDEADQRSLCGHVDLAPQGMEDYGGWGPYFPAGSVTGKVTDSEMAGRMELVAHAGHPCGDDFLAAPFLKAHPEYAYLKPILRDMKSGPWTVFKAGEKAASRE
jgi:hypothetical protein